MPAYIASYSPQFGSYIRKLEEDTKERKKDAMNTADVRILNIQEL